MDRWPWVLAFTILASGCAATEPCTDDGDCDDESVCLEGACEERPELRFDLSAGSARLVYRNDTGRIDLYGPEGEWILRGATAIAILDEVGDRKRPVSIAGLSERSVERVKETDPLGTAERLRVRARGSSGTRLLWTLSSYPARGAFTFQLEVENGGESPFPLAKIIPLGTEGAEGGGLFVGTDPSRHRILENGSHVYMDHVVQVQPGDVPKSELLGAAVPGSFPGHSVSNWNHAIKDLDTGRAWVAGALSFASSTPVMNLIGTPEGAPKSPDGRTGFSLFSAEAAYLPEPKPLAPGARWSSEPIYVHATAQDALAGLEHYAEAIKAHLGIVLWTEKDPSHRVPNGWNSWSGSGGTGGYGTAIDEGIILENLEVMATELRDFGMDWFQIDDGYEPAYGDWSWREDRFPRGARWLSDQIRARGLEPGLWIAPFTPDPDSALAKAHPDWLADKTSMGSLLASGYEFLDLTHPEVQAWLHELFRTFRQDWNFGWLKVDFAYWALLGQGFFDPSQSREEAYRRAIEIIREEVGDDTFLLTVAVMGIHYGLVDADRITVDSAPIWDWPPDVAADARLNQQGLKPTVRTAARRYFLHDRVWINHPDLIIFRSNPNDPSWPRVTLQEAQAFSTFVGLSGGIVKLGDRLVDLEPEHINTIRKLLPIYGRGARPLDLFERDFPERWHLRVDRPLDGFGESYDLVGLFHWGLNFDLETTPYTELSDDGAPLALGQDLPSLGIEGPRLAYEFWTGSFLGVVEGTLELELPAHSARVVALRVPLDRPQFLGWNRQITMGGVELGKVAWKDGHLAVETKVSKPTERAPFNYELAFFVPERFAIQDVLASGANVRDLAWGMEGRVLRLDFVPEETGAITLDLSFSEGQ